MINPGSSFLLAKKHFLVCVVSLTFALAPMARAQDPPAPQTTAPATTTEVVTDTSAASQAAPIAPAPTGQPTQTQVPPAPGLSTAPGNAGGITGAATDAAGDAAKLPAKYDVNKIGDRGIGKGLNMYSLARERAYGKSLATEVDNAVHLVNDPVVTEYVNRVAQNLVRHSDAQVPFVVKVIDDDEINAFALPGGYFYVNSGLVLAAENEAELAGVMAHEIAHVAARHATKNATKMQIFNLASIPLIFFGGPAGFAVRQAAALVVPMSFLKFSRDAEREADLLGLEYAYAAGYDPGEFVHFFETLRMRERQGKETFVAKAFATHPLTGDRIRKAQKETELLPAKSDYIVTTSEFDEVKAHLNAIEAQHRVDFGNGDKPVLRRRSAVHDGQSTNGTDDNSDRPTLRKH